MVATDYLRATVDNDGGVCVLSVSGELDLVTLPEFADVAAAALRSRAERFVLDLSGLSFVDCRGAQALADTTRQVPPDCPVIVRSVRPAVRRVLDLMKLNLELRAPVPADRADELTLERQLLCSAQQARESSRRLAEAVAATEDRVADTLSHMASNRPENAGRLVALSELARTRATHARSLAPLV
ncbi:MAG: STAS domain-containing protein [Actinobacteria bacterium]|nr:STAS domain-containing protein [Actinomycetota bacterium]